jgi:hypothetical protein
MRYWAQSSITLVPQPEGSVPNPAARTVDVLIYAERKATI